jgi:hypothetical protein
MIERYYHSIDPGGATGAPCIFNESTNVINNAISKQEDFNISGAGTAIVTVQLIEYTNNNNLSNADVLGIFINGVKKELNDTFQLTLNATGTGSVTAKIMGDAAVSPSTVYGKFAIIGVSIGFIGSNSTIIFSKNY